MTKWITQSNYIKRNLGNETSFMTSLTEDDIKKAEERGIPRKRVLQRFQSGEMSAWDAIHKPYKPRSESYHAKYKDQLEEIGLSYKVFMNRIRKGMTPEQALNYKRHVTVSKEDLEIAKQNGIKVNTVYNRVYNCGYPVNEAIRLPVQKGKRKRMSF